MLTAAVLLIIGLAAVILEFFIPAFGIIGLLGGASIVAGIIAAFRISSAAGSVFLISALIIVPVLIIVFFRIFPRTFFGRKLILGRIFSSEDGYTAGPAEQDSLNGMQGTALSDLRPSGTIRVDGKKYSAVSSGEYIDSGKEIKVIKTDGNRIVVKEVP